MEKLWLVTLTLALACLPTALAQTADQQNTDRNWDQQFRVHSTTFENGGQLPLSMVLGSANCSYVSGGLDESPEVSWSNPPKGTRSFVVTLFDRTAAFTHWGMYNISAEKKELPENAGVSGSTYGLQIFNDFYFGAQYDGPCPPNTLTPLNHDYVLTVFALDTYLKLPSSPPNFPANGETLYRAMADHIIKQASIHGFFSSAD
jgi:Raf kinase inhibitor-like YbhB/YbcL family protein